MKYDLVIILLTSFLTTSDATCSQKAEKNIDFSNEDFIGKTYIVAMKPVYPLQKLLAKCGTALREYIGDDTFRWTSSYIYPNNTYGESQLVYQKRDGQMVQVNQQGKQAAGRFSVIGLEKNKFFISYSCIQDKDEPAIWIHYYKRERNLNQIDIRSWRKIYRILNEYDIEPSLLQPVDNSNCPDDSDGSSQVYGGYGYTSGGYDNAGTGWEWQ